MKLIASILLLGCLCCPAADFDARVAFGSSPGRDVDAALKRAEKEKKRVLLFSYDPKVGSDYPGSDITMFMDLQETKKLVREKFIVVLLTRGHGDLKRYPSPGAPEKAYYFLLRPEGTTVKAEMVYRNPDVGLKTIKELIASP